MNVRAHLDNATFEFVETKEGNTKLIVPASSLSCKVPSKVPAFFNPAARLNRDVSVLVYNTFSPTLRKNKSFGDPFGGIGARSLRVAVEVPDLERIHINDVNPIAIDAAKKSARLNYITQKCTFTTEEVVTFLAKHDARYCERFGIVDLDPFGSPSPYLDCLLRSVTDGGMISITATDTAVLAGVHPEVCLRKYYGRPLKNHYSRETGLRLMISLTALIAARLDLVIRPIFVHANLHYLRVYIVVSLRPHEANSVFDHVGYLRDCSMCGNRNAILEYEKKAYCEVCGSSYRFAGHLWTNRMFDKDFVKKMSQELDKNCELDNSKQSLKRSLVTCLEELDDIPFYFLSDEIASKLRTNPNPLSEIIERLKSVGHRASRTSLDPCGFKTDARIDQIMAVLK